MCICPACTYIYTYLGLSGSAEVLLFGSRAKELVLGGSTLHQGSARRFYFLDPSERTICFRGSTLHQGGVQRFYFDLDPE